MTDITRDSLAQDATEAHRREQDAISHEYAVATLKRHLEEARASWRLGEARALADATAAEALTGKNAETRAAQLALYIDGVPAMNALRQEIFKLEADIADHEQQASMARADARLAARLFDAGLAFAEVQPKMGVIAIPDLDELAAELFDKFMERVAEAERERAESVPAQEGEPIDREAEYEEAREVRAKLLEQAPNGKVPPPCPGPPDALPDCANCNAEEACTEYYEEEAAKAPSA